jgi:hypothetical protein
MSLILSVFTILTALPAAREAGGLPPPAQARVMDNEESNFQ